MNKIFISILLTLYVTLVASQDKKLVCYHTNWSQYRPEGGKFFPEDIDAHLCTHIIYSFAKINGDTLGPYEWNDEDTAWSKGMFSRTQALKNQNPNLKILIAVGGWNHGTSTWTNMVSNEDTRARFVKNSIEFLKKNNFDGLDLDWEYPGKEGRLFERPLFTSLVKELKAAYEPEGLLLTAAVAAGEENIDNAYEVDQIAPHLDWINIMAYDYHGSWEHFTGHDAPLYARQNEYAGQELLNVDFTVNHYIKKGAAKEKLVLGMGAYGRSYKLSNPTRNKPGDLASGGAVGGQYTGEAGFLSYYEVCQKLSQGWTKEWDDEAKVPYAYSSSEWVGYDDIQSLKEKVDYVKLKGLGGAMFWALDLDDFNGQFCGQGRYPLINSVKQELNNGVMPASTTRNINPSTTTTTQSTTTTQTITTTQTTNTPNTNTTPTKPSTIISTITTPSTTSSTSSSPITTATIVTTTTIKEYIPFNPNNLVEFCQNGDGFYPDPTTNCNEYLLCAFSNTPHVQTFRYYCPGGFKFDIVTRVCDRDVICDFPVVGVVSTQTTTDTTTDTTIIDSTSTIIDTTTTTTTTEEEDENNVCSNGDGLYSDRESGCTKYIECVFSGTPYARQTVYSCPGGTLFSNQSKQCIWSDQVIC